MKSKKLLQLQMQEIGERLDNIEMALNFLISRNLAFDHRWREENGIIYFKVISDGASGDEWIDRLERIDFEVSDGAREILLSPNFEPTTDIVTEVAIICRDGALFKDKDTTMDDIYAEANNQNFCSPNAEVACLIREIFSDKEIRSMLLSHIAVMHEANINSDDSVPLLTVCSCPNGGRLLGTGIHDNSGKPLRDYIGFAFAKKQGS